MAEFFISGFIIILFSSIGMKYLYDSCKKDPVNINENIIRPGMDYNWNQFTRQCVLQPS